MKASPTRVLREEHAVLLDVLTRFEGALANAAIGGESVLRRLAVFVDVFRGYADYCHHRKEEQGLFVLLEAHELGTAVECMREEHGEARALISRLAEAVDAGDAAGIRDAGHGYLDLLRSHIEKENCMLFEAADECLTSGEIAELAVRYAEIETEQAYEATQTRCRAHIESLLGAELN